MNSKKPSLILYHKLKKIPLFVSLIIFVFLLINSVWQNFNKVWKVEFAVDA